MNNQITQEGKMADGNSFIEQTQVSNEVSSISEVRPAKPGVKAWAASLIVLGMVGTGVVFGPEILTHGTPAAAAATPPSVDVSTPIQQRVDGRREFLGQFSAIQRVELRAQVGGTLTEIGFKDGDIVQKGDLLFQIDPTPYQIKYTQAVAQLEIAKARLDLANRQMARAVSLKKTGAGSVDDADQKISEQRAATAAISDAQAAVRDAQFDLDHTRITAPFSGRIGRHQVSVGNLISGSRAGTSPTTLLTTLVSTDAIYLDFDMSEADYMTFLRGSKGDVKLDDKVHISLADETKFNHEGTLDFIDNALDRTSGTIHARATVPDSKGLLTPGGFARVRVEVAPAAPALLVPDAAVLPDQSDHIVLTVGANNVVTPKEVEIGDLRDGLRVILSGLDPKDVVIIGGIPSARPGAPVTPHQKPIKLASSEN
jgi:multidrug efflux system membrane fusion protein